MEYILIETANRKISPLTRFKTLKEAQNEMALRFSEAMDFCIDKPDDFAEVEAEFHKYCDGENCDDTISTMEAHCETMFGFYGWKITPLDSYMKTSFTEAMEILKNFDPSDISVGFFCNCRYEDRSTEVTWQEITPLLDLYESLDENHECWFSGNTEITVIRFYTNSGRELFIKENISLEVFASELESTFGLKKNNVIGSFVHKLGSIFGL